MDSNMMPIGPTPFFYYTPEQGSDNRQPGFFNHNSAVPQQMQMYPAVPTLPSTPIYSRPNSSGSPLASTKVFHKQFPSTLTPSGSPQFSHKPGILVQGQPTHLMVKTESGESDGFYYPATPPLSTSGSSTGSPRSIDMLATPLNPMFSGLDGSENVKSEGEVENLDKWDWSSCGSPPMTPGKPIR